MYEMTLADCLFMKKHRFLFLASLMALVLLGGMAVVACSNNFKHVPRTGFVTHQVKNCDSHIPFDAIQVSNGVILFCKRSVCSPSPQNRSNTSSQIPVIPPRRDADEWSIGQVKITAVAHSHRKIYSRG